MRVEFALIALAAAVSFAVALTVLLPSSPPPRPVVAADARAEIIAVGRALEPLPPAGALGLRVEVTRRSAFAWPAEGPLTSYFGLGHPTGIDIGLDPGADSPIRASAAGVVSFAGGSVCCDYGLHIIIEHEDGLSTLYGHFSRIGVAEGDHVEQGQVIGLGGSTGDADGKHVHFEVRVDGAWTDPLRYLPFLQQSPYPARAQDVACPYQAVQVDSDSVLTLHFVAGGGPAYVIEGVSVTPVAPVEGIAGPEALLAGGLGVVVSFPLVPAAAGQTVQYQLEARLRAGDEEEVVACRLDLRARLTLSNSDASIARYRAKSLTPTRTPVATSTPRRVPTATLTPVPPTRTSVVRPPTFAVPRTPTPARPPATTRP